MLPNALDKFCSQHMNERNDWYNWKFDDSNLPIAFSVSNENSYSKNILLKEELHKAWKTETDIVKKGELIRFYISTWGGIRSNSSKSMNMYINDASKELIDRGKNGIASWSKALVLHDPEEYAIFDARVSTSLNCLQYLSNVNDKILFPILSSRNKTIIEGQRLIVQISKEEHWKRANITTFYRDYLQLLKQVAENRKTNIATVEMLLFAKAEELVNELKLHVPKSIYSNTQLFKKTSN